MDEKESPLVIDTATDVFEGKSGVAFSESDRLRLAKWVLIWLAVITVLCFGAYIRWPDNAAAKEVFEMLKVGALPLVTLVVSFYFPNGSNK